MIEVELKFRVRAAPPALSGYPLIGEKSQTDVYYDGPNYVGIKNGNFLRVRDKRRLEFKLNSNDPTHLFCKELDFDAFDFPEKSDSVNRSLKLFCAPAADEYACIEDVIGENNLVVIGKIEKRRAEYKIDDRLTAAVDVAKDLGVFLEFEVMVDGDVDDAAAQKIKNEMIADLTKRGLLPDDAEQLHIGYLELYLYAHNRDVYEMGLYKNYRS